MTDADIIAHWRKGANDELQSAKLLSEGKQYAGALFHCHLAVEKGLKALYMQQYGKDAPFTHNLLDLAETLNHDWSEQQKTALDELTDFMVAARYSDPLWARQYADAQHASKWVAWVGEFLCSLHLL